MFKGPDCKPDDFRFKRFLKTWPLYVQRASFVYPIVEVLDGSQMFQALTRLVKPECFRRLQD